MQVAERWILARLRHETFFSLAALNARIAELLADLNARPDAPVPRQPPRALRAARPARAAAAARRALRLRRVEDGARVNIDYHVELHRHYYSVPYALVHEDVDARAHRDAPSRSSIAASASPPIVRSDTPRPAHHRPRPHAQGPSAPPGVDALAPHRLGRARSARRPPPSSRRSSPTGRIPSRAIARASASCASAKRYGAARLEAACARAVRRRRPLLPPRRLDPQARPRPPAAARSRAEPLTLAPVHEHVRGRDYYQ